MAVVGDSSRVLADRYELRERVGRGGMGEVWLGHDRVLNRSVAVKLLLSELSLERSFRDRFEVEARAAAAMNHPNVVSVYDVGESDGTSFIVMERLPGPSLDGRLRDGTLDEAEAQSLAADVLAGLGAAHEANLVHRDVKPGNILRSAGKRWKVGDFGVAKDLAATAELTLVGVAVGTPAYLAPEQLLGHRATFATDLWATGVVLYEALTGTRPFSGTTPLEVANAITSGSRQPLASQRADLSPELVAAVERALSRDPAYRFASAGDMADAIDGKPVPPPIAAVMAPAGSPEGPSPTGAAPAPLPRPVEAVGAAQAAPLASDAQARGRPWLTALAVAAFVAVIGVAVVVGALLLRAGGDDRPSDQPPTGSPTTGSPTTGSATTDPPDDPGSGSAPAEEIPPSPTTTPPDTDTTVGGELEGPDGPTGTTPPLPGGSGTDPGAQPIGPDDEPAG